MAVHIPNLPSSVWNELGVRFEALRSDQGALILMKASGDYMASARHGKWRIFDCIEKTQAQFELAATQAGTALRSPHGVRPFDYWLDKLFRNLVASHSEHVRRQPYNSPPVRIIEDACRASAIFCARLERAEIEGDAVDLLLEDAAEEALSITAQQEPSIRVNPSAPVSRAELRVAYFALFPNAKILDVCWAARQHYSEWKRWLRGPEVLKDGSAPDLAFRAMLRSGRPPEAYRQGNRPSGWK